MNLRYKYIEEASIGCAWFVENPPSTQAWIKQSLSCAREDWLIAHRVKNPLLHNTGMGQKHHGHWTSLRAEAGVCRHSASQRKTACVMTKNLSSCKIT